MTFTETGCGEKTIDGAVSTNIAPITCADQQEKQITTTGYKFLGAREEVIGLLSSPADISHGVDAEVLDISGTTPSNEAFAVAWAGGEDVNYKLFVRRYSSDPAIKDFLGPPQILYSSSSSGWVRRMGFDNYCTALYWMGGGNCAWFVWQADTPTIKFRAINVQGTMSSIKVLDEEGWQPSGDRGQKLIQIPPWINFMQRKTLLAWISKDRDQIKIVQIDTMGNQISNTKAVLANIDAPYKAYQTAVAWSGQEKRWIVAWTEHAFGSGQSLNGVVYTNYVNFDGQFGSTKNFITYCEGDWYDSGCSGGGDDKNNAKDGTSGSKYNDQCVCKGIWLASSYYSSSTDRYRLQQYGKHTRLNSYGIRAFAPAENYAGLYSPIAEANFLFNGKQYPFQALRQSYPSTENYRLEQDSYN